MSFRPKGEILTHITYRSMPIHFSMGTISSNQSSNQTSYIARLAWQHSFIYSHIGRQTTRRQCFGYPVARARCILCHGSRLHRLRPFISATQKPGILCYSSKIQSQVSQDILTPRRQKYWTTVRSNHHVHRLLCQSARALGSDHSILLKQKDFF